MRTPGHNFRCPWATWDAAMARAKHEGTDLSPLIVAFLEEYGKDWRKPEGEEER